MFKTMPATEPPAHQVMDPAESAIPVSVLALDLDPPVLGWDAFPASRNIPVVLDDVGRRSISRADARQLLTERRENEARAREVAERQEQQAIEADRRWRAQLNPGTPWYEVPAGVLPVVAMTQAAHDARPRRRSVLEDALSNSGTTLHSLPSTPDGDES
jgi:hypothetical protein